MTIGKTRSALTVVLMLLFAAVGQGDEVDARNGTQADIDEAKEDVRQQLADFLETDAASGSRRALRLSVAPAQSYYGAPGMRMELFARAGLSLLNVAAEDSIGIAAGVDGEMDSMSASRLVSEFGWGGGARLMSGNWGIEGTYSIFESLSLSPGWLVTDDVAAPEVTTGLLDLPLVASRADVLVGQVVRAFPLSGGRMELFLGLGAGWMRATDSSTDRLLSGVSFPQPQQVLGELPPELPAGFLDALIPEVEFTADRSSVVYAGSLGVSLRVGRILLRPRVDVIISRALTTELTIGFPGLADLAPPDAEDLGDAEFRYATSVTPRIFLLSVDIGLGN